jgi:hypothetical protein
LNQEDLKVVRNRRLILILALVVILALCCLFWAIRSPEDARLFGHYLYAPLEAPFCLSKIGKRIGVTPDYSAIDEYIRKNLHGNMDKTEVRRVLERISSVGIDEYDNVDGTHSADVVMLMCDEPLNNLVYTVKYSPDGKFISIEREDFP